MDERLKGLVEGLYRVPISRRRFWRGSAELAVNVAAISVAVSTAGTAWVLRPERQQSLIGRDIEGESVGEFVTDGFYGDDQIPLRKSPKLGDREIIGWTKPGFGFWAQKEYGVTYESPQAELGQVKVGDDHYGIWYRGVGLPVFDKVELADGTKALFPRLDEKGNQVRSGTVHVAGNFLIKAPEETSGQ